MHAYDKRQRAYHDNRADNDETHERVFGFHDYSMPSVAPRFP